MWLCVECMGVFGYVGVDELYFVLEIDLVMIFGYVDVVWFGLLIVDLV